MNQRAVSRLSAAVFAALSLSLLAVARPLDDRDPLVDTVAGGKGRINYAAGVVKATGYGAPPVGTDNPAQAKLMALGAAKADALRNLAMAISSVQVTSTTTVKNYVLQNDTVETKVSALLQSPRVLSQTFQRDGTAVVTVELPLYGKDSIAEVILPEVLARPDIEVRSAPEPAPIGVPDPAPFKEPAEPAVPLVPAPRANVPRLKPNVEPGLTPLSDRGPFTSVLIDCRGIGIQGLMSPKVYDTAGREVYGTVRVDPDFAVETGIVGYPRTMFDALRSRRAGGHPLIVRALRAFDRYRTDPVIALEDADRIIAANRRDGFLERTRVIFLVDPVR
jgi:hypothetical protein